MTMRFTPGNGPFEFDVRLEGDSKTEGAAFHPPFDIVEIFSTRARVPVRGTINGYPFRSSLCNMGSGHMLGLNREMRAGARCRAGDLVRVVMERDTTPRVVEVPADLRKILAGEKATAAWEKLSYTHQKEWVKAIEEAKQEETRQRRIGKMLEALKAKR
jgi:Bacteriocin-protection, YdeI or OmpD-Associated/Domain of unknown function (DUF1905)